MHSAAFILLVMKKESKDVFETGRREFLLKASRATLIGAGLATGLIKITMLTGCASAKRRGSAVLAPDKLEGAAPILSTPALPLPRTFTGDGDPGRAHAALWNKGAYVANLGGLPAPTEQASVVIVGGGLAGLSAAWMLRDSNPLLLEQATRFGGNSKAESWDGIPYSLGAAYFGKADEDDPNMRLMAEVGLSGKWREDHPIEDRMLHMPAGGGASRIFPRFWFGGTDPARAADFQAAWKYFERVRNEAYPDPSDIGAEGVLTREQLDELDKRSFYEEIKRNLGKQFHPHMKELVSHYSWSTFAAEADEVSAVSGLYNLASDLGGIYTFPGGNACVTQAFFEHLIRQLGTDRLRREVMVLDVRPSPTGEGVHVTYQNPEGTLRTVAARACIVAVPKFVAKRLIDKMPQAQHKAMSSIEYRSALLTNVLIKHKVEPNFYDQYIMLGRKSRRGRREVDDMPFTDATLATFATHGHPERTVLGLYRGYPYKEGRSDLLQPGAYEKARAQVERKLPQLLQALNIPESAVVDVRIARWGHPMPLHRPGMIASGLLEKASAPIADRIFFAQQDNWANPCLENVFAASMEAVSKVRKILA